MKPLLTLSLLTIALSLASARDEDPFAVGVAKRNAAEQRVKNKAAEVEQAAREKREVIGRLPDWLKHPESKDAFGASSNTTVKAKKARNAKVIASDPTTTANQTPSSSGSRSPSAPYQPEPQPESVFGSWISQMKTWVGFGN